MDLNLFLLLVLVLGAVWAIMTVRLLYAVVGLALVSAVLSVLMFQLKSPLAAVFELSVCAGLIPVIFITTISFTQPLRGERLLLRRKERLLKFWYLPLIVSVAAVALIYYVKFPALTIPPEIAALSARNTIWKLRHLDLLGQVIILLAGAFGVAALFKEEDNSK